MSEGALTPFTACDAYRYTLRPGTVNDVTKVGHAQNIYYQRIAFSLIHILTLRRNVISLAIFNAIF